MRWFGRAATLSVIAGLVLVTLAASVWAEDERRGLTVDELNATNLGQLSEETSTISSSAASAALFDCDPDQFPPCANPPCDLLEMLNPWCASNVDDVGVAGIICTTSDLNGGSQQQGFVVADDFFFLADAEIQGVSWWGLVVDFLDNGAVNCDTTDAPPADDSWTIRYWPNTGAGDLSRPDTSGAPIREFTGINTSTTQGTFTRAEVRPYGSYSLYEMTYTFDVADRFVVNGLETVWLEITNQHSTNSECVFCWEVAFPTWNGYSLQKETADPWDPEIDEDGNGTPDQPNVWDQAQCQDVCFNEAVPNPPAIDLELFDSAPVDQDECCLFRYNVINQNSPGAGPVTKFYMAVHRGDDDLPDCGEDLSEINPPPGYTVSYCEAWRYRQTGDSDWVIYQFDPTFGGEIPELGQVSGTLRLRVNDFKENNLQSDDADDIVPPFGVRAWGSQRQDLGDQFCGGQAPGNFDPLAPVVGVDPWSDGSNGTCTNADDEPLRPIPSGTVMGKGLLAMLLIGAGLWLVIRSRRPVAA